MEEKLTSLNKHELELLFEALLFCIRANSGVGFKGYDQGHPVYQAGASGENDEKEWEYADSPEKNLLYQLYREISLHMVDSDSVSGMKRFCATNWQEFCMLATKYERERDGKLPLPPAYDEHA